MDPETKELLAKLGEAVSHLYCAVAEHRNNPHEITEQRESQNMRRARAALYEFERGLNPLVDDRTGDMFHEQKALAARANAGEQP